MKMLTNRSWIAISLAATTPWAHLIAQESEDDEVFTLSPFTVTSEGDDGYRATSTTAGSRLNTQLKDVAASVTVLTDAFMDDLGATDIATALSMVAGVETDLTTDQTDLNLGQGFLGGDFNNPNASEGRIRIRGLGRATNAANYLEVVGPLDRFNMERTEFLRGPSALLFGLGEAAGVVNYSTKRANLQRDINKINLVLDNWNSRRLQIDFSRVLIEDKLALRLAGVTSDQRYRVETAQQRNDSIYLSAAYKPFEGTKIDAYYEDIAQEGRRPNYRLPQDNVTDWLREYNRAHADAADDGMVTTPDRGEIPLQQYLDDNLVWDASWATRSGGAPPRSPDIPFTERELTTPVVDANGDLVLDANGSPVTEPTIRDGEYRRIMDVRPDGTTAYFFPETGWDDPYLNQFSFLGNRTETVGQARNATPNARVRFARSSFGNDRVDRSYVDRQVLDETIFPFLTQEIGTFPGNTREVNNKKIGFNLEQKINKDLYFNFSYLDEEYHKYQNFGPLAQSHAVSIDINKYLPGAIPNPEDLRGPNNLVRRNNMSLEEAVTLAQSFIADGTEVESNQRFLDSILIDTTQPLTAANDKRTPNPGYLRPFFHGRSIGEETRIENEAFLAQLNYSLDFVEKSDKLGFLGKHNLTGFMSGVSKSRHNYRFTSAQNYIPGVFDGTNSGGQPSAGAWVTPVWYIGDPIQPGDTSSSVTELPTATFTGEGELYDFYGFNRLDTVTNSVVTRGSYENRGEVASWRNWVLNQTPEYTTTDQGAWGTSLQSFFMNGRIVTTFGYRKDTVKDYNHLLWDNFRQNPGSNSLEDPVIQERIRRGLIPADITEAELVGNFRRDNFRASVADVEGDGSSLDDFILGLPFETDRLTAGLSTSSVVFHATQSLRFFYNQSENLSLSPATRDGFGKANERQRGETEEFGVGLSMFENKLDMKFTVYETKQKFKPFGNGIRLSGRIPSFENRIISILEGEDQRRSEGETTNFDITDWEQQTGTFDANGNPIFTNPVASEVRTIAIDEDGNQVFEDVNENGVFDAGTDFYDFDYAVEADTPLNPGTTADSSSEGWEFEATYNPNRNLRVSFNASKLENVDNNIELQTIDYVRTRAPFWNQFFERGYHNNGDNDETRYFNRIESTTAGGFATIQEYVDGSLVDLGSEETFVQPDNSRFGEPQDNDTLLVSQFYGTVGSELFQNIENEGLPSQGISEYNARLTANYSFREGAFKGFSVGTNLRWESGKSLGAPLKVLTADDIPEGFPNPDLNGNGIIETLLGEPAAFAKDVTQQFESDPIVTGGLSLAYRGKLHGDKVSWRIQLNVDNVFKQGDDLRVIRLNPDGAPIYGINRPTTYKLTNSFDF